MSSAENDTHTSRLVWRVGRKVGRTIYAQTGGDDTLIGVMDTPELAARVVIDHNAALGGVPGDTPNKTHNP